MLPVYSLLLDAAPKAASKMPEINIMPERVNIGGFEIGVSVFVGWGITILLLIALFLLNKRTKSFTERPKGLQRYMELIVGGIYSWSKGKVGEQADRVAPVVLTLMAYVAAATLIEMFGFPPATDDLSCTLALGLSTFILVNITALRALGLKQRLKRMASPNAMVFPIKLLTDCVAPFSMALRLFANVLVGGIVMKLVYAVVPVVLPAILSAYFNIIEAAIQTFVFGLLSLNYINEAIE